MDPRIWKIMALPLIIGGAISIILSIISMDHVRVVVSEMIVLLLGLLILLMEKNRRYLAFIITGILMLVKFVIEVIIIYPDTRTYIWADLLGSGAMLALGMLLKRSTK